MAERESWLQTASKAPDFLPSSVSAFSTRHNSPSLGRATQLWRKPFDSVMTSSRFTGPDLSPPAKAGRAGASSKVAARPHRHALMGWLLGGGWRVTGPRRVGAGPSSLYDR